MTRIENKAYGEADEDEEIEKWKYMKDEAKQELLQNRWSLLKKTEKIQIKDKADFILEKSKLSEKELLAEVLFRLVSIEQAIEQQYDSDIHEGPDGF